MGKVPGRLSSALLALAAAFSSSVLAVAAPPQKAAAAAAQPDYSQEAAVIESYQTDVRFENDGTGTRDVTVRVRVQSNAGVEQYGVLVFGYASASEQLDAVSVRVRQPDGTVVATPPSAIQDLSSEITRQAPEYSDYREKHVAVKGLSPSSELEYHAHYQVGRPLVPGQFWLGYDFMNTGIVLDEELRVSVPAGRALKVKSAGVQPVVTEQAGRRTYLWKSRNLKDVPVRMYPLGELPPPAVLLSTFQSWGEVGRWWGGLERPQEAPAPEVRAQAAKLTQGLSTDAQKIQALYHYVATQFHYISISFGIGRYQPHAAGEVLKNEYGDCKDQYTLLASLLQDASISAWPALINSTRKIEPDVPSPGQFDHVVTVIPQGHQLLWMDTTSQVAPLGFLSFNLRNKQALVIPRDKPALLAETPPDSPQINQSTFSITGKLGEDGTLNAKVEHTATGDSGLTLRLVFRSVAQSKWKDLVQGISALEGYGGTVSNVSASSLEDTGHPFSYSYDYTRKDYSDWKDHQTSAGLPPSGFPSVSDDPDKASQPIQLGPLVEARGVSRIELPKGYTPTLPDSVDLVKPFAEYHAKYSFQGGTLQEEREVVVKAREVPAAQREDYRSFQKAVSDQEGRYIVLNSGGETFQQAMQNPEFNKAIQEANAQWRSGNFSAAADALRRATAAEPDSAQVWEMVGSLYGALHENDQAFSALRKAIALAPTDPRPYQLLAYALTAAHRQEEALQVWRDFVQANPQSPMAHASLGYALLGNKQYAQAVTEYQAAAKLDPKDAEYMTNLGIALSGAGKADQAVAAFEKAAEIDPSPPTWNNVGYDMAENNLKLPEAEHFVKMAVGAAESDAAKVSLKGLQEKDLRPTHNLSYYWDSLGWVYFRQGNLEQARKYVEASWELDQFPLVADHLGQIDEKLGRRLDAIHEYAMAVALSPGSLKVGGHSVLASRLSRPPEGGDHLRHLVGSGSRYDAAVDKARNETSQMRTYRIRKAGWKPGDAEFFVLIGAEGEALDVKFLGGSEDLRSAAPALAALKYRQPLPDPAPTKLLRRGVLSCSQGISTCDFVLYTPNMVRSVQ